MSGQVIADRYRLLSVLGRGGMATVWRGADERLGRAVAVKRLERADATDQASRERFDREARTAAGLSHPNIVDAYDVGVDNDAPGSVKPGAVSRGRRRAARGSAGPRPLR